MSGFYLQVEALNLSDFIFDTDDLSTRRGGSLMLLRTIEEVTKKIEDTDKWLAGNVTVIQEGASVGLYRLEPTDGISCDEISKRMREIIRSIRLGESSYAIDATFGVACIEATGNEAADFQRDRQKLLAQVRWDQMQRLSLKLPAWNDKPSEGPCDKDKVRPSARPDWKRGSDKKVSEAVFKKHEYGKAEKQKFYEEEIGRSLTNSFVNDLEDLTEDSTQENLNGKMAIIHIDGNGFGQQFDAVARAGGLGKKPWELYGEASKKLKEYRRDMLAALLAKMEYDTSWQNGKDYRIETLLWGGDEITWVVPAWKGWETLQLFYEKAKTWTIQTGVPVTHAAGLVFCNHKAPIQRMIKLAEDLCHAAKADKSRNLVAFQVLESFDFMGGDLEGFREGLLPGHEKELVLVWDAMDKIPEAFAKLKAAIPRKQVYKAAQEAHEGTLAYKKDAHGKPPCVLTDEAGSAGVDIAALKACLGASDEVFWYHVRELWDYIPKPAARSTGKGVPS
jgi:hypothetical protein